MPSLLPHDWGAIFALHVSLLEIFLRGSVIYLVLVLLMRLFPRREVGSLNVNNLLIVVLLADAVQNGMTEGSSSVTDVLLLVVVLLFWSWALDWLSFRFPAVERFINPEPRPLILNGRLLRHNMRRELITLQEMLEYLREQGIDDPKQVKAAYIEGQGHITVIRYDHEAPPSKQQTGVS